MAMRRNNNWFSFNGFLVGFSLFALGAIVFSGTVQVIQDNIKDVVGAKLSGRSHVYYIGELGVDRTDAVYHINIPGISAVTMYTDGDGLHAQCASYDYTSTPYMDAKVFATDDFVLGQFDLEMPDEVIASEVETRLKDALGSRVLCQVSDFTWESDEQIVRRILRAARQDP